MSLGWIGLDVTLPRRRKTRIEIHANNQNETTKMNIVLFVDLSHPLLRRTFVCCRLTPREYVRTFMKGTRSSPGSTLMTLYGYKERRKKKKEKNFSPFFKRIVLVKEKLVRHAAEW